MPPPSSNLPATEFGRPPMSRALWLMVICGCLISMLSFGTRSSFGLFVAPISGPEGHGFGREAFAFALAIQNLAWGIGQPFAGGLSDRFGPWRVLAGGGLLFASGLALMTQSTSPGGFALSGGILIGLGLSGAGHNTVLVAFGQLMPDDRRVWAIGLATAASSLGQFALVPLGQAFIESYGWSSALLILATTMAATPLLALALRGEHVARAQAQSNATAGSARTPFKLPTARASSCGTPPPLSPAPPPPRNR